MFLRIYTMTHKKFDVPSDKMYVPLQVGRALSEDLGYSGDDTGENISELNRYYSELTGLYWVWKNVRDLEYVGTCHYRRYLVNAQNLVFTEAEYRELFKKYDMITTKRVELKNSYYDGFAEVHHKKDLDAAADVIREKSPEIYPLFEELVHGNESYFGNIFLTSKQLYDEYCEWLFGIFSAMQERINVETYDDYHKRVFGFISEFLQLVWIRFKKLKVCECTVGMIGEKAETREMKERLSGYFRQKDFIGAKEFLLTSLQKRPDVLLEASDITGELKLSMQVISACEFEYQKRGSCILDRICEFRELMGFFAGLNRAVEHIKRGKETKEDREFLQREEVSREMTEVAAAVLCKTDEAESVKKRMEALGIW